jgi:hypothetical protein
VVVAAAVVIVVVVGRGIGWKGWWVMVTERRIARLLKLNIV